MWQAVIIVQEAVLKENVAISVKEAGMRFNLNQEHVDNLKEYFIKILKRDLKYNEF